ncbi:MAG: L,D-transpeptidase family protein [Pseudolabrys sp.]
MRSVQLGRLAGGVVLAAVVGIPAASVLAAPDRVQFTAPHARMIGERRQAVPTPPQQQQPQHQQQQQQQPVERQAEPVPPPPVNDAQNDNSKASASTNEAAAPSGSALDIKGALDKLLAANDSQIAQKLHDMMAGKRTTTRNGKTERGNKTAERGGIEQVYASRNYEPIWIKDGRLSTRAKAAIMRLKDAAADGLDTSDYPVPEFGMLSSAEALAEGDVKLSHSVVAYAHNLEVGRIAPTRVLTEVSYGTHATDQADLLKTIINAQDTNAAIESFNPPAAGFKALKAKLAELRGETDNAQARIPEGPLLKYGMKDARVPALRQKLGVNGKPNDILYDKRLFNAVRYFQKRSDIRASGDVDSKTLNALNGPKTSQKIDTVLANMERWRWLPRDLGETYVMVNIPDYTLKVVHDKEVVWRTKIVAGKPQTATPLLSAPMDNVIVNPSWYVPQSIIQNELLPQYASDPNIFDRMGLEVKRGPDGHINVVQPPGAANALGRIKFNFPNKFQVYLHDTPEKRLFAYSKRAFSHGCMRVEDPTKFGEIMLHLAMNGATPDSRQIYAMFGKDEKTFKLASHPIVHLTYQTAFVDDAGKLQIRDDIYGFDARIHNIMHSDERRVADVAPPPDPKRDADTAKSNQEVLMRVERREAANPLHFFERLFR